MHPLSRGAFQFSFTPGSCRYSPRYEHQGISAGTSSACTRACALFQVCCSYVESLRIRIDIYRAHLFEKRTANGKCKPFDFEYIVVISRLIQSQHQLIAASTRPAVYPDRRDILIFEIILQFLNSILTYLDHIHLLFLRLRATLPMASVMNMRYPNFCNSYVGQLASLIQCKR